MELGAAASVHNLKVTLRELYENDDPSFLVYVRAVAVRVRDHHDHQQ